MECVSLHLFCPQGGAVRGQLAERLPGQRTGTDWTSGGKQGRAQDAAEGEAEKEKCRQTICGGKEETADDATDWRRAVGGQRGYKPL